MVADLGADDVHDLLRQLFYDCFLVGLFVEGRGRDDGAGMGFVATAFDGLAEGEDDIGAGSVGEVGGCGGDRSGHAEEVDPDAAVFFCRILIEHKCGLSLIPETTDEGAHGAFAWDDGHAGFFTEGVELFVDARVFCDGGHAGHIKAAQAAFQADQFPVAGMGGDDDVGACFKVGAVFGDEALVFAGPLLCETGKPEDVAHGLREADQRLDEDSLFFSGRF